MFRVWGPDSAPHRPMFVCPGHMGILRRNLIKIKPSHRLDLCISPSFDPADVSWEEVTGKFQCRMEFDPDAVPCGLELGEF